jgi:hypothetical protein
MSVDTTCIYFCLNLIFILVHPSAYRIINSSITILSLVLPNDWYYYCYCYGHLCLLFFIHNFPLVSNIELRYFFRVHLISVSDIIRISVILMLLLIVGRMMVATTKRTPPIGCGVSFLHSINSQSHSVG